MNVNTPRLRIQQQQQITLSHSRPGPSGDRVHTPEELLIFAPVKSTEPSVVFHMVVRRVQLERRSGRSLTAVSRQTVQSRWSYLRLEVLKQLLTDVHRRTSARWKIRTFDCPRMVVSQCGIASATGRCRAGSSARGCGGERLALKVVSDIRPLASHPTRSRSLHHTPVGSE